MSRRGHVVLLALAGLLLIVPGARLLFDSAGYAAGKDNLAIGPDLYSELRAMGAIFVASGLTLLAGATVTRLRLAATVVGVIALLPQGIARVISYAIEDCQHDSYLRVGIVEIVVGTALALLLTKQLGNQAMQS